MRIAGAALAGILLLFPLMGRPDTGVCQNDDGTVVLSLMTNDGGQLLDLAVVTDEKQIDRFPEANSTKMALPRHRYKFSAKKTRQHGALELDLQGDTGKMKYQGKAIVLECNWN